MMFKLSTWSKQDKAHHKVAPLLHFQKVLIQEHESDANLIIISIIQKYGALNHIFILDI